MRRIWERIKGGRMKKRKKKKQKKRKLKGGGPRYTEKDGVFAKRGPRIIMRGNRAVGRAGKIRGRIK